MALKWGIASAGNIAHDFVNALGTLSKDDHQVVAVAARDLKRAEEFSERFDIPKAYGSYLELAKDPNVEIVQVATLHPYHLEVALLMLEHGKHVLVETPMCINEKQIRTLTEYAKLKNLFAMEGVWSRMFPSYKYIREQIESGKIGAIVSVDVEFGFSGLTNINRMIKKELGGGGILEFGVYLLQFCQWVFKSEVKSVKATGKLNDDGIDLEVSAEISYGGNKVAHIKSSIVEELSNTAKIVGTKGTMTVPSFWTATSVIDIDGTEKTWPLPQAKYEFNYPNSCGLRYEADNIRKCIRAGKTECELFTHQESITISHIQDEIRKQIGLKYSADD